MTITSQPFGTAADGTPIERYTLTNTSGMEADIITLGATLTALRTHDRSGALGDVLLGFDTLEPYLHSHPFFGSLVGRFGNRIANAQFTLGGVTYQLAKNDGPNHLHGGPGGFHQVIWQATPSETPSGPSLALRYVSADMEEGYPGTLTVTVVYTLTNSNELQIDYTAATDKLTVVNLTNHAYFNLACAGDILSHQIALDAPTFVPVGSTLIPTGELRAVKGTPMDLTGPIALGAQIDADDEQLRYGHGYDHTWVFAKPAGQLATVCRVSEASSGRVMELRTTEPGVQLYTGNMLDGKQPGKGGATYPPRSGFCLETQHFPDSPNQPQFPSTELHPGEEYRQTTIFAFSTQG